MKTRSFTMNVGARVDWTGVNEEVSAALLGLSVAPTAAGSFDGRLEVAAVGDTVSGGAGTEEAPEGGAVKAGLTGADDVGDADGDGL